MLTEDGLGIVLARLEKLSADRDRFLRARDGLNLKYQDMLQTLEIAQTANRRHERDMQAAEAKIAEWAEYASQLRSAIDALDPTARRKKKIVLPTMPEPLEIDIPF